MALELVRYDPTTDGDAVAGILSESFGLAKAGSAAYVGSVGDGCFRVVRDRGRVVGCLALLPMGQWFGGRRVPMTGVAAVGVHPAARGTGVATTMMRCAVEELHADGVPIATLYPAVLPLYRRAGFELAGTRHRTKVACEVLATIDADRDETELRALDDGDDGAVVDLQRTLARRRNGPLDRHASIWWRTRTTIQGEPLAGYGVFAGDALEGYLYLRQEPGGRRRYDLAVSDFGFATPRAGRRLLHLLGQHRSLGGDAHWPAVADDPCLALLPEVDFTHELDMPWMTRVVDVPAALEARGYLPGLEAELELSVTDELCPRNDGAFTLCVADGRGRVTRGGSGALEVDVRGLAALFTGFLTPFAAVAAGRARGPEEALARAAAVFAGSPPAMQAMF